MHEVIPQNGPWTYMGVAQVCNLVPVPVAVSRGNNWIILLDLTTPHLEGSHIRNLGHIMIPGLLYPKMLTDSYPGTGNSSGSKHRAEG